MFLSNGRQKLINIFLTPFQRKADTASFYSYQGRVGLINDYRNNKEKKQKTVKYWTNSLINDLRSQIRSGTLRGNYGFEETRILEEFMRKYTLEFIVGRRALVIGTEGLPKYVYYII